MKPLVCGEGYVTQSGRQSYNTVPPPKLTLGRKAVQAQDPRCLLDPERNQGPVPKRGLAKLAGWPLNLFEFEKNDPKLEFI